MTNYQEYLNNLSHFELKYAPSELFYEGDFRLLTEGRRISIVGSRKPSKEAIIRAQAVTKSLVSHGIIVVSGLAEGIDTVAHTTAIELSGKTIAVLGTPLNKVYPKENKDLLNKIKVDHLAISQFPEGNKTYRSNFPMRNRTMALISDATIIIEASENSGTKHQGWEALRLGRSLYILENIIKNPDLSWPKQMVDYGAIILSRENIEEILEETPNYSNVLELSF